MKKIAGEESSETKTEVGCVTGIKGELKRGRNARVVRRRGGVDEGVSRRAGPRSALGTWHNSFRPKTKEVNLPPARVVHARRTKEEAGNGGARCGASDGIFLLPKAEPGAGIAGVDSCKAFVPRLVVGRIKKEKSESVGWRRLAGLQI